MKILRPFTGTGAVFWPIGVPPYDVLVGVNLLREGLDLPEVSLVADEELQHLLL